MSEIALDMDSTLSATTETAFEVLAGPDHDYSYDDFESWDWPIDEWGTAFLDALHGAWMHEPLNVPLMEPYLAETVADLVERHTVDIVTHQPMNEQVSRGKKAWLAYHEIDYNEFVAVDRDVSKAELDYDYYIDDKPSLPSEVNEMNPEAVVYLRNQPYNKDADGDYVWVSDVYSARCHLV